MKQATHMKHLLFLWCISTGDIGSLKYLTCDQNTAVKVMDAGPMFYGENDNCLAALDRWISLKRSASVHNEEALYLVCEVPK